MSKKTVQKSAPRERTGYVDLQKVVDQTKRGRQLREEHAALVKIRQAEVDAADLGVKNAKDDKERSDRKEALQTMMANFQKELVDKSNDFAQQVMAQAQPSIEKVAKEKGFSVLVSRSQAIVFVDPALDLTEAVIKDCDKRS